MDESASATTSKTLPRPTDWQKAFMSLIRNMDPQSRENHKGIKYKQREPETQMQEAREKQQTQTKPNMFFILYCICSR